jgi:hypothetical protein
MTSGYRRRAIISLLVALLAVAPVAPASAGGGCNGPTVVEQLSGSAFNGVVPEGRATADESQFPCGGSTILTVQVKNINLPDGTVVNVSLDFTPIGNITLSRLGGTLVTDLGHFAVSNDEVRVAHNGQVILIGPFFR